MSHRSPAQEYIVRSIRGTPGSAAHREARSAMAGAMLNPRAPSFVLSRAPSLALPRAQRRLPDSGPPTASALHGQGALPQRVLAAPCAQLNCSVACDIWPVAACWWRRGARWARTRRARTGVPSTHRRSRPGRLSIPSVGAPVPGLRTLTAAVTVISGRRGRHVQRRLYLRAAASIAHVGAACGCRAGG